MSFLLNRLLGKPVAESNLLNEEVTSMSLAGADLVNEVLIQFGGKKQTQFGQVVIMAGGAGSGKGFVLDNLVDVQGRIFDVDAMKKLASKAPGLVQRIEKEFGTDISKLNLKVPENVSRLHSIIDNLEIDKSLKRSFFNSVMLADPSRKPNIIFDVTLKSLSKLVAINEMVTALGYQKQNIHIVWVLNDLNVALSQNAQRDRVVPEDILKDTHDLVSREMSKIMKGKTDARKYMDGVFVIVPNQKDVDSNKKSGEKNAGGLLKDKRSGYLTSADYLIVKKKGASFRPIKDLGDEVIRKIKSYVPNPADWIDESKTTEVAKTSAKEAITFAKSVLPDLSDILPDFGMNYNKLLNRLKDAKFKREDMPVIRSKDYDNFREFLDAMNVGHKTVGMKVGRLKPSQKQIFLDQILDGIAKNGLEKSIKWVTSQSLFIISNDGFIIDGHHRYATGILVDDSIQVNTLRVDLPQKELLKVALDFSDNVAGNDRNKGSSKNINVL